MANFKSKRVSLKILTLTVIILVLVAVVIMLALSKIQVKSSDKIELLPQKFISFDNSTSVSITMPAIDDEQKGVLTYLTVEATPGTGRILVDIDNLLFWEDTQQSMRIARKVAANVTGKDIDNYDLIYNIYANASNIGGPSAGAAITIATIAALEGKKLNESVLITGSINHDGTIGPAGNILEKAKAASYLNASLFLVPLLQSKGAIYNEITHCEEFGVSEICSTEQIPIKINIGEESGIKVIEVQNITEVMSYMLT
jgi:uncharacterized protein